MWEVIVIPKVCLLLMLKMVKRWLAWSCLRFSHELLFLRKVMIWGILLILSKIRIIVAVIGNRNVNDVFPVCFMIFSVIFCSKFIFLVRFILIMLCNFYFFV